MSGSLAPGAFGVLAGMFVALILGSMVRLYVLRADTTDKARSRRASLRTWWILALVWSVTVGAQAIESTPCRDACFEQKAGCISRCGEHIDPIECEQLIDGQTTRCG